MLKITKMKHFIWHLKKVVVDNAFYIGPRSCCQITDHILRNQAGLISLLSRMKTRRSLFSWLRLSHLGSWHISRLGSSDGQNHPLTSSLVSIFTHGMHVYSCSCFTSNRPRIAIATGIGIGHRPRERGRERERERKRERERERIGHIGLARIYSGEL